MKIFVFVGPTLPVAAARAELDAIYLPPASQGDVYAATRQQPWAIGIIDGYFERVPAVWHKEILWAMSRGVHVFGSASMGALRAAELHPLGMEGTGLIFEAFRNEELEDDDEVAVVHGPADQGFVQGSEAMVNIRFTLAAAASSGIIEDATRGELVAIAKSLFYPDRQYPSIIQRGVELGLPAEQVARLAAWLPQGRVEQKRADALAMLRLMRQRSETTPEPKSVGFSFQHTDAWEQVRRQIDRRPLDDVPGGETLQHDAILDELRIEPGTYIAVRTEALIRALCLALARHEGAEVGDALLTRTLETFRRERTLFTVDDGERWLADQALTVPEFARLMEDQARVHRVRTVFESEIDRDLPDMLRLTGRYGPLAQRARAKQELLSTHGLSNPATKDIGVTEAELLHWYFEEHLQREMPEDLGAYALAAGFGSGDGLRRAVLREYCYVQLGGTSERTI